MKNKATHIGTCQLCGCTQMLPSGRLAKHGYSVDYGYGFVGTCIGSGELPFEVSKDFIVKVVADMQKQIDTHIPAVVPELSHGARYNYKKTPEEQAEYAVFKRAIEHNSQQKSRQSFVAMQTPLIANWSVKPLTERAAEETIAETKKAANRGIRLAARTRDDAKRAWYKACDKLERLVCIEANAAWKASYDEALQQYTRKDLYVDVPHTATNTSAKICALAKVWNLKEQAEEVESLLANYKVAADAYLALKNA
jgi:hypothetical protein